MKYLTIKISMLAGGIGILLSSLVLSATGYSQTKKQTNGYVKIVVEGTSNLHDWNIKSDKGVCTSVFDLNNTGALNNISQLSFSIPAESLKSEHSGMDKNTYKALNTGKYASIQFVAGAIDVKPAGNTGYQIVTRGKLTIAGVSKDVVLTATGVVNPDKSITYSGSYSLNMKDYKIEPPTALLGTIRTGEKVVVKFNLVLRTI